MVTERFLALYRDLSPDTIAQLATIYSEDIVLVDPVGNHKGLADVSRYFDHLLENNQSCRFEIHHLSVADGKGTVTWTMHYQHPKLASGKPLTLDGVSEIHIDNDKINYQRDYYDLGSMIYEHIPILGFIIKKIKQRLKGS